MILPEDIYVKLLNLGGGWPRAESLGRFDLVFPVVDDTVRQLFVDPVNGDDTNDGRTAATALATIQRAVLMFKQPFQPATWDADDDRTITVIHSAGLALAESVVIPPHAGQGALIIEGQANVIHAGLVVDNPAFSAIAGFNTRRRLNFTTAPMTPSALADTAFVRGPAAAGETVFEQTYNNLPIVDNAAGTADCDAVDPGLVSAFNITPGAVVDIVQPQTIWRPPDTPALAFTTPICIINQGGPLVVRNFLFEPPTAGAFAQSGVLDNSNALGNCVANMVGLTLCHVRQTVSTRSFNEVFSGEGAYANGNLFTAPVNGPLNVAMGVSNLSITNLRATGSLLAFESTQAALFGIDWTALNNGSVLLKRALVDQYRGDIRGGGSLIVRHGSHIESLVSLSVEGAAADALQVRYNSSVQGGGANIAGSAGNAGVGASIEENSSISINTKGSPTLAGAGGQLQIGAAAAAQNWAAGAASDAAVGAGSLLARYS